MSDDKARSEAVRPDGAEPPLPPHRHSLNSGKFDPLYTAAQMRSYAAEQVAAERERCAGICEDIGDTNRWSDAHACASAIRGPN